MNGDDAPHAGNDSGKHAGIFAGKDAFSQGICCYLQRGLRNTRQLYRNTPSLRAQRGNPFPCQTYKPFNPLALVLIGFVAMLLIANEACQHGYSKLVTPGRSGKYAQIGAHGINAVKAQIHRIVELGDRSQVGHAAAQANEFGCEIHQKFIH